MCSEILCFCEAKMHSWDSFDCERKNFENERSQTREGMNKDSRSLNFGLKDASLSTFDCGYLRGWRQKWMIPIRWNTLLHLFPYPPLPSSIRLVSTFIHLNDFNFRVVSAVIPSPDFLLLMFLSYFFSILSWENNEIAILACFARKIPQETWREIWAKKFGKNL